MWIGYNQEMPVEPELARVSKPSPSEILTVTALARSVRDLIEKRYPLLWVAGEISNFIVAKSGHAYFVLKDEHAQVRCVMFRYQQQHLDWQPADGIQVEARALVTLYEARGDFQLNVETMRRAGTGVLFEAFVRLRDKLAKQGLFDPAAKRPLPAFPRMIGVITSRDAAALQDVLTTLKRRNPSVPVILYPAPVQGEGSAERIAAALKVAGTRRECDVLLLVRGGGSLEDLWAFNQEVVARAVRACPIPVVTGIGHETDFTIADFSADQRAPTPTAAAELASPQREQLLISISHLAERLRLYARREFEGRMQLVDHLARRLVHPGAVLHTRSEMLGQLRLRLAQAGVRAVSDQRWRLIELVRRSQAHLPDPDELSAKTAHWVSRLSAAAHTALERAVSTCTRAGASLVHLDPTRVLERGYSLVQKLDGSIVRDSNAVAVGETISLRFAKGGARARIGEKTGEP
jgi:exodeoxyribonuclease VII large subunit